MACSFCQHGFGSKKEKVVLRWVRGSDACLPQRCHQRYACVWAPPAIPLVLPLDIRCSAGALRLFRTIQLRCRDATDSRHKKSRATSCDCDAATSGSPAFLHPRTRDVPSLPCGRFGFPGIGQKRRIELCLLSTEAGTCQPLCLRRGNARQSAQTGVCATRILAGLPPRHGVPITY